uniref:VWFD domain-containing protein n=1 Tax=Poecilia formosa TaxID=48698 RepID=A0A096M0V5_POEFO
ISIPPKYRGNMCGLCGNFNGNPNDDFHTPSGSSSNSADVFGAAWKIPGNYTCSDGCGSSCAQCNDDRSARAQCEVIQAADGPFSFCHEEVDPAPYFSDCVFDVCVSGNRGSDLLCRALETYVSVCQSANVRVYPWRQNTTCSIECPANSHYELCGTDCGHSCASSIDAACDHVCSEGCFCDEGFSRSGSNCVPVESCGCQHDGFYFNAGESFWTDGCSQRCECQAPNVLICSPSSCTPAQECTIRDGHLGCYDAMSTCTVWGDPHYITFDGALAHFQGSCSYIITESLRHNNETQYKVVATNKHRGNNLVSFVSSVDIYLSNPPESVHVRLGPYKRVKVNGAEVSLPTTAGMFGQVMRQGSYIVFDAVDVVVQFDGSSTLLVRMGRNYQNRVSGMCGNFNGDPTDDKVLPNGTLAKNDNQFGHSWKSDTSEAGCGSTDESSGDGLSDCRFTEEYTELCRVITNTSGPFSSCHLHSDPQPFLTSCVYDLCLYTSANGMLCSAVSAYEKTCTNLGLSIPDWRSPLRCGMSVLGNTFLIFCFTCFEILKKQYNQIYVCKIGLHAGCLLQLGMKCHIGNKRIQLDHGSRGCTFNDLPVQLGDSFWSDSTCAQKCTCTNQGLQCSSNPCSFSQICRPGAFQYSCQTVQRRTCTVSGDPHYYTFDESVFHFQGTCTYVLSEQCQNGLPYYRVEGKNEHRGSTRVSWTRLVKVFVHNETIELVKGHEGQAKVNGSFATAPFSLRNGSIQVYQSGFSVIVSTDFGLMVSYDMSSYVRITVPYTYQNSTCGLCGNFNNHPEDDFRTRQGQVVSSDVVFANSWKVSGDDEPGCDVQCSGLACAGCTAAQTALYRNSAHCGILENSTGPFAGCHQHLPPGSFVDSCVYDLCVGGGYQPILCQALNVYSSQCQQNGIQPQSWRRPGLCEIPCPANSHYEAQGTGCPPTCVNPNSTYNCPLPDQESCVCNSGYLLSGGVCVPHADCGCSFEGHYYRSGETVILDADCGRRCTCSYGSMTCSSHSCGQHESCRVEDGVRGCTPNSFATCWIRGPGSYHTFDGVMYQYPGGTCRYVLATVCNDTVDLHQFSVKAKNEPWFGLPVSITAEKINCASSMKYFSSSQVNGITRNLPIVLNGSLSIFGSGFQTFVKAEFGLSVMYDGSSTVSISVPPRYRGNMCGLCGNFNGNPNDDFHTPSGALSNSADAFGAAWKVPGNYTCSDGCGSSCPQCNNDRSARAQCEVIQAADGPFSFCHEEVDPALNPWQQVDACVEILQGSSDPASTLCEVLRDYALMCQHNSVSLGQWRNATGCELTCPSNSHYELCGSSCPSSCPSLSFPFTCDTRCQEGCQCDDGFVLNGNQCVPPTSCGCFHDGRYRQ